MEGFMMDKDGNMKAINGDDLRKMVNSLVKTSLSGEEKTPRRTGNIGKKGNFSR